MKLKYLSILLHLQKVSRVLAGVHWRQTLLIGPILRHPIDWYCVAGVI